MRLGTRLAIAISTLSLCLAAAAAFYALFPVSASSPPASGHAAATTGDTSSSNVIGPYNLPPQCSLQLTTASAPGPSDVAAARVVNPPSSLTASVQSRFGGCNPGSKTLSFDPATDVGLAPVAQIEYSGTEGHLTLVTVVPDAAAVSQGYSLGAQQAGTFSDGVPYFTGTCVCDKVALNLLQWASGSAIIQMLSSDLSLDQLEALAPSVVVS